MAPLYRLLQRQCTGACKDALKYVNFPHFLKFDCSILYEFM